VSAQSFPVELIVQGGAIGLGYRSTGNVIVPFTIPVPAPRRKNTEVAELNPPPPAVTFPFKVRTLPAAGTSWTMLVPVAVTGPLIEALPELVT
jgi:hypothetical protein